MRESYIEQKLGKTVRSMGCLYYKFISPGNNGVPDRIIITPSGRVYFVELKQDTGELGNAQHVQIGRLLKHKQRVRVIYGSKDTPKLVREIEEAETLSESYL